MNEMKCKLRNVNLSPEKAEGGSMVGACDISLQTEYTEELHQRFTKQKKVTIDSLKKLGASGMGLTAEIDMLVLRYRDYVTDLAKLDKASVEFDTNDNVKFRIRAYLADAPGMAEDLSVHKGEAIFLQYDDENDVITLQAAQGDMVDGEDHSADASPKPAAEKRPRKTPKKDKAAKGKNVSGKTGGAELKVVGDEGVELTDEQKAAAQAEKEALMQQYGTSGTTKEDEVVAKVDEWFSDLADVQMGQGDAHDFNQLSEKHNAGRKLTDPQLEKLMELHLNYCKAA